MKTIRRLLMLALILILLPACAEKTGPTPRPTIYVSNMPTASAALPTLTPIPTRTPIPPTPTPLPRPKFNILIRSCDTGVDIFSQLGEVTNAYVTVQNVGNAEAADVVVTLLANDEDKAHPDKSYTIQYLPVGYQMTLKLTVDTQNGVDTRITAEVRAGDLTETAEKASCPEWRPDKTFFEGMGELFTLIKINP
ncbi:MAG TPA: hypothetical protein PKW33_03330 [Anaerolineaceae bacterium]|nr:hypothetical protein [Anaerolineaceae bacterium]HPN50594.1 hypothetical protein [Anaerolineaceae bacterium]